MVNKTLLTSILLALGLVPGAHAAGTGAQSFTLDGILYAAGTTTPLLDASAQMKLQILDPSKSCVLYEESQTINTQTTNGYFNIKVGSALGSSQRTTGAAGDPGNAMAVVFANVSPASIAVPVAAAANGQCASGYSPASGDVRYLRVTVTPSSSGVADTLSPDMTVGAVPTALVAESVTGISYLGGNIGIGTISPSSNLHVFADGSVNTVNSIVTIENTTNNGNVASEVSLKSINKEVDIALGGPHRADALSNKFYINDSVGGVRMVVDTVTGRVGIGQQNPGFQLDVLGVGGSTVAYFEDGAQSCSITPSTAGNISCSSDEQLKKDITPYDDELALEKISALKTVTYRWKKGNRDVHTGFIAQQVEKVTPEFVSKDKEGFRQLSYVGFVPLITGALKALKEHWSTDITQVRAELADLKAKNEALAKRLEEQAADIAVLKKQLKP